MKAHVGDRIVLAPPTVSAPVRDGEVLETRGPGGEPPYVIRWSDGHVGVFFPGPGSVLSVGAQSPAVSSTGAESPAISPTQSAQPTQGRQHAEHRHVRDWEIRVSLFESDDDTRANAVLLADSPHHLTATGTSHRGSHDTVVPEIGDEVAVARALRHLADQLVATAEDDIEQLTGERDITVRPT